MTSFDILESPYCVDYSVQSSNDSKLPLASPRLPLPTQVISSPSCPPPLSYYENNPKAKGELIQKATARLRCRLLQEGLTDVQSKVSQLRSQLDDLRIELSTTENVLSKFGEPDDRQLQALERRFNTHQQQLDQVLSNSMLVPMPTASTPTASTRRSTLSAKALTTSTSFTSTLSRMSSIFSSARQQKSTKKRTDSVEVPPVPELFLNGDQYSDYSSTSTSSSTSEEDDHNDMATPSVQEAREKRLRRRQRVKKLRREYQQRLRFYDPSWNEDGEWQSARSPSTPSVDNHPLPLQSDLPSTPPPQQQEHQQPHSAQQQSHKIQPQQNITVSPTNETATTTITTTIPDKKPRSQKEPPTTTSPAKKTLTTSTAPVHPKPATAQCLCKKKSTNKPGPVRHHKAASTTSQTYHSKQPEWISLKTSEKQPPSSSNQTTPQHQISEHHSTAIPANDNDNDVNDLSPPRQFNVSGWLLDQQQLHLQQQLQEQHQEGNNSANEARMESPYAETMGPHAIYNRHGSSTSSISPPSTTSRGKPNGHDQQQQQEQQQHQQEQQQHQQALNLFDDVLHYLDTFSDFGSDAGLQQDISLLLSSPFNNQQDVDLQSTTSTSSSSYWSHYHQLVPPSSFYQQIQLYRILVNHGMATFSQYIVECVSKGVSWCKFLSVLSLACLISLGRGPEHMLLSLDDLDYLDLLCGQDEFAVDSYYL